VLANAVLSTEPLRDDDHILTETNASDYALSTILSLFDDENILHPVKIGLYRVEGVC
jgi:hypothetical protein